MKVLGVNLDMVNKQLKNLADGSAATDGVTLQQLQAAIRGLDWKDSVRVASTATVTVATPGASIDGVTLANGERVLLKDQSTASQNGIYIFNGSAAALTRAVDADASAEVTGGMAVTVTEGTVNADRVYVLTTNDPIVIGTTSLAFAQLGGGSSPYTASTGLTLVGQDFRVVPGNGIIADGTSTRVDPAVVVRKFAVNLGDGSTTSIVKAHGLGTADLTVLVKDATSGEVVYPDIVVDATNVTCTFATAPTTNQYRLVVHG